jgi:dimethylhistidine N-methyltransferase
VHPLAADFLQPITLPNRIDSKAVIGFFPGSTIGNLDHRQAQSFLARASATLGPSALFLIGVDLPKDRSILIPAYDDAQGVTAAFNRNLLHRLNREADADFDPDGFAHRALWNAAESRIEMHLVSMRAQTAHLAGHAIFFDEGETIHTENSHKYGIEAFHMLARAAGWTPVKHWLDADELFSIHLLSAK